MIHYEKKKKRMISLCKKLCLPFTVNHFNKYENVGKKSCVYNTINKLVKFLWWVVRKPGALFLLVSLPHLSILHVTFLPSANHVFHALHIIAAP